MGYLIFTELAEDSPGEVIFIATDEINNLFSFEFRVLDIPLFFHRQYLAPIGFQLDTVIALQSCHPR